MASRKRGRPPIAAKIVAALEAANMQAAADIAREAGGLPPRTPTHDEVFLRDVRQQAVGGPPVVFTAPDLPTAAQWCRLVASLPWTAAGRRYEARQIPPKVGLRVEVRLS